MPGLHRTVGCRVRSIVSGMDPVAHRPKRIILVRHGESEGNVDDSIYETVPDHALHLTPNGREQAIATGRAIRELIGRERVRMWVSPYVRTRETAELLDLGVEPDQFRFEPRIREQDWANFQDPDDIAEERRQRDAYGHFWYRFKDGESGADVYDRVSTFLESMFRDFVSPRMEPNAVLVTHGLTMRLFCMRWFHWGVEYFESLSNPSNAGMVVLLRQPDSRYKLQRPFDQWTDYAPTARERASWL